MSYLHNCEESVEQVDSLNKGLGAVAKETGQAPQFFHSGVSAFCRNSAVILKMQYVALDGIRAKSVQIHRHFDTVTEICEIGSVGYLSGDTFHQLQAHFPGKKVGFFGAT